jgi:hypothetical protein
VLIGGGVARRACKRRGRPIIRLLASVSFSGSCWCTAIGPMCATPNSCLDRFTSVLRSISPKPSSKASDHPTPPTPPHPTHTHAERESCIRTRRHPYKHTRRRTPTHVHRHCEAKAWGGPTGFAAYTGTSLYEQWTLASYNVFFALLPVIFVGIFEQDAPAAALLQWPELYVAGRESQLYNLRRTLSTHAQRQRQRERKRERET